MSVVSCWNIRATSVCLETKQLQSVNINIWMLLAYEEEREGGVTDLFERVPSI